MKQGFLSHHCCCGKGVYTRHIITIEYDGQLLSVVPFSTESAHTIFCDELLLVVTPGFDKHTAQFLISIRQEYESNKAQRITDLIMHNEIYRNHHAAVGTQCHVYAMSHIDNTTLLPIDIERVALRRIF